MGYPWTDLSEKPDLGFDLALEAIYFDSASAWGGAQAEAVRDLLNMLGDFELAAQPSYRRVRAHSISPLKAEQAGKAVDTMFKLDFMTTFGRKGTDKDAADFTAQKKAEYDEIAGILAAQVGKPMLEEARYEQVFPVMLPRRTARGDQRPYADFRNWLFELGTPRVSPRAMVAWLSAWHGKNTPDFYQRFR